MLNSLSRAHGLITDVRSNFELVHYIITAPIAALAIPECAVGVFRAIAKPIAHSRIFSCLGAIAGLGILYSECVEPTTKGLPRGIKILQNVRVTCSATAGFLRAVEAVRVALLLDQYNLTYLFVALRITTLAMPYMYMISGALSVVILASNCYDLYCLKKIARKVAVHRGNEAKLFKIYSKSMTIKLLRLDPVKLQDRLDFSLITPISAMRIKSELFEKLEGRIHSSIYNKAFMALGALAFTFGNWSNLTQIGTSFAEGAKHTATGSVTLNSGWEFFSKPRFHKGLSAL